MSARLRLGHDRRQAAIFTIGRSSTSMELELHTGFEAHLFQEQLHPLGLIADALGVRAVAYAAVRQLLRQLLGKACLIEVEQITE